MAINIAEAPVEVTKATVRTVAFGGRLALRLGWGIIQKIGLKPEESASTNILKQQALLRQFNGKVGVANIIERGASLRQLEQRVSSTAHAMLDEGLVDKHTTIELRPVLPEDTLRDPELNAQREMAVKLLQEVLESNFDVAAVIPSSHPIMPAEHEDSTVSSSVAWGAITTELDGLIHQINPPGEANEVESRLAMLAISGAPYTEQYFGKQVIASEDEADQTELLVLRRVGRLPQDNLLVASHHPHHLRLF